MAEVCGRTPLKATTVALFLAVSPLFASPPGSTSDGPDDAFPKRIEALRVAAGSGAPELDGRLDEPVWERASWITDFVQKEPEQGAAPTVATEVAFLFDSDALYVGARMQARGPDEVTDRMTRRDAEAEGVDRLIVSLDTFHDGRTAYTFAVTAAGVRIDWFHPEDNEHDRDRTFDPVWEARTRTTVEGWFAEMRIPFSQLRFRPADELVWGVNVRRSIPALDEEQYWVLVPRDETGWASRMGELVGIRGVEPTRRIELVPYVAAEATLVSDGLIDADDPFHDGSDTTARTGLDFRMGLGPNLTLSATVNPDFGQVEADPAEVNLSAFETFFPERRPFFTEGRQTLSGDGPSYYYSRRIGAPPHRFAGGDFRDSPNTSTILGAAKVTGQLGGGWQLGTVAALTDDETARVFDLETGTVEEVEVEPRTGYGALRIQRQFGVDASTVGLTLTGVERGVEAGGALAGILTRRAYAGGIDWNRRFDGGAYELMGHVGFSHVRGDSAAIDRLQRSSVHYFQRPDQDHVDVDPGARSLSGWSAAIRGGKRSGTWRFNGGTWIDSPGFDINDLGRLSRGDEINQWGGLRYVETDPGRLFRRWVVGAFTDTGWNFDGVRRRTNGGVYFNYTLPNFWHGWIDHGRNFGGQSDTATRGGPLMERPAGWWVGFGIRGNPNASTGWGFRTFGRRDELGSWTWRVDPEVTVRPTDRLTLSLEPRWVLRRDARQFVTTVDGGPARTFGRRYVFGEIERSEVAAPVRVNYAFTPDLGLEFYAEPFAASGRYSGIGELAAPRSSDLIVYGEAAGTAIAPDPAGERFAVTADGDAFTIPDPDFEALSFRSNLVLRWEYRPGSSLFLVWQQNRSRAGSDADRVGGGELLDAFSADGENVLAVKLTWWMTP